MGFREMVEAANKKVFLDTDKFAELRTVRYGDETYKDIPVLLVKVKQTDQVVVDNGSGLFLIAAVLRCALSDLDGIEPEKGQRISVNDKEGGGGYFSSYTIATSACDMGMIKLELEAIDE